MLDHTLNAVKHQVAAGTVQNGLPQAIVLGLEAPLPGKDCRR